MHQEWMVGDVGGECRDEYIYFFNYFIVIFLKCGLYS